MWGLVTQVAGLALGVAASPLPIVAVMVILLTKRARFSSLVFLTAWIAGNVVAITVAILFADQIGVPRVGPDLSSEGIFLLLLGVGLTVLAGLSRRGRLRATDPSAPPSWVKAVDNLSPLGGAFVAFTNATTSPKNLAFALTAGLAIQQATLVTPRDETLLTLEYVAIASISILIPVVVYFVGGEHSATVLRQWKERITTNASAIGEVMVFLLGLGMSVKGLVNLLS